ncbi:MAG: cupin domain-containing protein [Rhodobacteraceae bacterium]|nr:cupin domain-containing protein [Paracoccaceae bacterium]
MPKAQDIIQKLDMHPHPEGGWYRQTWIADVGDGVRPCGSAIYYLLEAGQKSHWHRIDSTEIWIFNAGAPLILSLSSSDAGPIRDITLGPDILAGQQAQAIVVVQEWQAARSTGDWTLVTCTVAPAFDFAGFHMAPNDWQPGD